MLYQSKQTIALTLLAIFIIPVAVLANQPNSEQVELLSGIPDDLEVTSRTAPVWPASAIKDQVSGEVVLAVTVLQDGSLQGVEVINSNPEGVFDDAAIEAISDWSFEWTQNANSRKVTFRQTIEFSLGS